MTAEPTYTPPEFTVQHGRYAVTWSTEELRFEFERSRQDRRSGELTAELAVVDTRADDLVLSGVRVNLTSGQARSTLVRQLEGLRKRGDWSALIEFTFRTVREEMRRGDPAILLRDAPVDQRRLLLDPLLTGHGATFLFGDGGSLKSLLALAIGATLQTGEDRYIGLRPVTRRKVLILDWEWDAAVHRRRLAELHGPGELPDIAYLRCDAPLVDDVDRVRSEVRRHGSEYLILDSAAWAAGDEPEKSDSAKRFFEALRLIGLDSAVVAHTTKVGADAKPFGSVFWHNGARMSWHVTKEQELGEDTVRIGLLNRKNNDGRLARPLGWEVRFADERIRFERVEAASIATVAEKLSIADRARHAVREAGQLTYVEIADQIGERVDSVRRVVDREVDRGHLVKLPGEDNVYRIAIAVRNAS